MRSDVYTKYDSCSRTKGEICVLCIDEASWAIKSPHRLLFATALNLFDLQVTSIAM